MKNRVEHDVWYIDNWSFSLDLKIITATVLNTIRGEINAY
nr:sugar transferase [uncultured Muribaculum sp.]